MEQTQDSGHAPGEATGQALRQLPEQSPVPTEKGEGPPQKGVGSPEKGEGSPAKGGDPPKEQGPALEPPKFFSQLSREKQEAYREFLSEKYGGKTLNDAITDLVELHRKAERSILVPPKDAPQEEREAFLRALGVPALPSEYELPEVPPELKDAQERFRKFARSAALTKEQARIVHDALVAEASSEKEALLRRVKQYEQTFTDRVKKEVGRDAEKKLSLYRKFLQRFADSPQVLKDLEISGVLFSEKFALKIADIEEALSDMPFTQGSDSPASSTRGPVFLGYGEDFRKKYGGR